MCMCIILYDLILCISLTFYIVYIDSKKTLVLIKYPVSSVFVSPAFDTVLLLRDMSQIVDGHTVCHRFMQAE